MRRIQIYDTTLRDGAQAEGVSFSLQDKLLLTRRLDSMGFDWVEGGYPASNDKDCEYFQRVGKISSPREQFVGYRMDFPFADFRERPDASVFVHGLHRPSV